MATRSTRATARATTGEARRLARRRARRGPYRTYIYDSSKPIPRTTRWRNQKKTEHCSNNEEIPFHQNTEHSEEDSNGEFYEYTEYLDSNSHGDDAAAAPAVCLSQHYDVNSDDSENSVASDSEDEYSETLFADCDIPADNADQHQEISDDMFLPLYSGADVTVCGAYFAILQLKKVCRLPFSTIKEVLRLLQLLCPKNNKLPSTVYQLRNFFSKFQSHKHKTLFCPNCGNQILDKCQKLDCLSKCSNSSDPDVLIQLDIPLQLKTILSRNWNNISCSSESSNFTKTTMLSHDNDFFSSQEHIGLIMNTDGVSLYKSSKVSLWPVYLEIANLCPKIRFRHDNVVICALWVGRCRPDMQILLAPIFDKLKYLNIIGFRLNTGPDGMKTVRVKLLFCVADLVAKAKILNMKQFNGHCGCPTCIHPGEHVRSHIYLPDDSYLLRTPDRIERAIRKGNKYGIVVEGIKGVSSLHGNLDFLSGMPNDYMHCVLEGVVKYLLKVWTDSKYFSEAFSIRQHISKIDSDLLRQTPPHEFARSPRTISADLSYWKANEFRVWLLFYSAPILVNILPPLYFHHYSLLVCAMHIFLCEEITESDCDLAEKMLHDFYKLLPELYGNQSCTINAHLLSHIAYFVRLWGPCWTHSTFSFESHNGALKRMVHSTRRVAEQLSFSLDVAITLQNLYFEIENRESESLISYLQTSRHTLYSMKKISHGYSIGNVKSDHLDVFELQEARKLSTTITGSVNTFERLYIHEKLFHTNSYRCGEGKRKSCYCSYINNNGVEAYGEIQKFAECSSFGTIVFVRPFRRTDSTILKTSGSPCRPVLHHYSESSVISRFILEVHPLDAIDTVTAIPAQKLVSNCCLVQPSSVPLLYVIKSPNNIEHH